MKKLSPFLRMNNVIQNYSWGSTTSLHTLFDISNPAGACQAELWMGAHPNGCSHVVEGQKITRLDEYVAADKDRILGAATLRQFGDLPYLFKVLAAEQALSIQVHPSKEAAERGFALEEKLGISRSASHRNYKDANHKPELVYALTPFKAMNGFRDYQEIIALFEAVGAQVLKDDVAQFSNNLSESGLQEFFTTMVSLQGEKKTAALAALMDYANERRGEPLADLIIELERQYPGDGGIFSPLLLNCITLEPGEAMFLQACTPHAYIHGTFLEIMANSDNVLRSGLTPKHIDVKELIDNTSFIPKAMDDMVLLPEQDQYGQHYAVPVDDFAISIYKNDAQIVCQSAEIIFAIDGKLTLEHDSGAVLSLEKG